MTPPQETQHRDSAIDALRGIAILLVLAYHYTTRFSGDYTGMEEAFPNLGIGRAGVFLFFVISGYCIAMTAERSGSVQHFWLRRFTRLQPALMACILLTIAIVGLLGLPGREASLATGLSNAAWIPLFTPSQLVDGAYWSILVEVKFYFIFGLLFYLLPKAGLLPFLAFTAIGAALHVFGIGAGHQAWIYPFRSVSESYLLFPYSLFFLVGIAARLSSPIVRVAVTAACIATMFYLAGFSVLFAWAAGVTLLGAVGLQLRNARVWKPLVFIGFISYPLYLLHQNIGLAIIRALDPLIHSGLLRIVIATAIVILLAGAVSWSVEHRFRRAIEGAFTRLRLSGLAKTTKAAQP
jgi:peptidoglycan/LPS O-acetylase OafA/YrhL